ncbi:Error-prone repair protein ImuA [Panacibacter ginsenosidivorans]|uniref:Error-prone repair protein ImuA n=1 Tax=Panacibacter ginsenosidivorans TaxID=1813871 RepID=A0A5B8VCY6_9BACT|nr:Error-prone repair protein ImuA [Panacibacter ginsenosidivorans]QEC69340.1 Error-prone repair protein ImuA [Panacibacter ginsenosidivorans]
MTAARADIIAQLQRDILPLEGYKPVPGGVLEIIGLGAVNAAFPDAQFPLGAVHEFICKGAEEKVAAGGFIAGILAALMQRGGVCVWIGKVRTVFPPALVAFGIAPERVIFVEQAKEKELLWAVEEALKCEGLAAVVSELSDLDFTTSRRLQLAVEKSRVTGFIVRVNPRKLNTTACVTRWKISSLPSEIYGDLPGVGYPRWQVQLQKVRNGRPGNWRIEWQEGRFRHVPALSVVPELLERKAG